jgi:hypothetical protein
VVVSVTAKCHLSVYKLGKGYVCPQLGLGGGGAGCEADPVSSPRVCSLQCVTMHGRHSASLPTPPPRANHVIVCARLSIPFCASRAVVRSPPE